MSDSPAVASPAISLPGTTAEIPRPIVPRPGISHVVFDFDGTLSWLRHGWPEMMLDALMPHYTLAEGESEAEARSYFLGEILALNGKPSVFQCQRFCDIVAERGGPRLEAEPLRVEFQTTLDAAIGDRMERIRKGVTPAAHYLIHGALAFLEHAQAAGLKLAILSSTVQVRVIEEAKLLGIDRFFGRHIYGGTGDPLKFSKRAIFDRLIEEENITPGNLLSFGDGPVEIRDTKELGGMAVAVCSDELKNGSGISDPHKRSGLFAVGADAAIPDYRDAAALLDSLLGK